MTTVSLLAFLLIITTTLVTTDNFRIVAEDDADGRRTYRVRLTRFGLALYVVGLALFTFAVIHHGWVL